MQFKFRLDTRPKGYRGNPSSNLYKFFIDDWPLLRQLVPIGTNLKERFKKNLAAAFVDELRRKTILAVMEDVWNNIDYSGTDFKVVDICCHRPFHPELMLAFKEFLEENFAVYVNNFIKPSGVSFINGRGSDWTNFLDKTQDDQLVRQHTSDTPQVRPRPETQGHFKDSL